MTKPKDENRQQRPFQDHDPRSIEKKDGNYSRQPTTISFDRPIPPEKPKKATDD